MACSAATASQPEPVVLFSQDGCPDGERVRTCFRVSGVPLVERNVTADPAAAEALLATGVFATPVVVGARLGALAETFDFRCRCPAAVELRP